MKILRTILWVLVALGFLIFAIYNWQPVELTLWQNLVLETKVPVLAMLAFALGFLPMWALHRSMVWGLNRRIRTLENSLKNTAYPREREVPAPVTPVVDGPVDKSGKSSGEPADVFNPVDTASDGSAGE
ncbi:MAG: LapA family protein [Sphingomonadales bacterium]|nr:MAG: LapA family protein [Sphingomonadales bacterium]